MNQLIEGYGSFRLLCEAYWRGLMASKDERLLEESVPKEILIGYKPILLDGENAELPFVTETAPSRSLNPAVRGY